MKGVHVAIQGVGSVGGGLARLLATDGARLALADVNADKAKALAEELGAETVDAAEVLALEAPIEAATAAISSSAWKIVMPNSFSRDRWWRIAEAGVIG